MGIASAIKWDNVAYWSLNETSGPIKDITGNGHDGAIVGNPLLGVEGKIGNAININYSRGHDNYINTSDLDLNGSASYSLWAIQKEGEDDVTYLSKRDRWGGTTIEIWASEKVGFCIRTVSENSKKGWTPLKQFLNTLSRIFLGKDLKNYTSWGLTALEENCVFSTSKPSVTEWHNIIAVYDYPNKNMSLYIDGRYNSSTIHNTGLPFNNKNYVIGANAEGAEGFDGGKKGSEGARDRIDEVGIWNRALSSDEVKDLYNSGKGRAYLS
ncbi:MAG: hypothetical protein NTW17_02470 [Candidatus Pacearchaeota archaeon]|nr:hypothetical protein [Candidatus Pacearchaeota archaeon]